MANPGIGFALLFLMTLAVSEYAAAVQESKMQVVPPVPVNVVLPGKVAVPIQFTAGDYNGPYDPLDPKGINAALHRQLKIENQKNAEVVKSYIPPGLGKLVKKEGIKLAMDEGRRFAVSHPKETADLIGIVTRAKNIVDSASHKIKAMEKERNNN